MVDRRLNDPDEDDSNPHIRVFAAFGAVSAAILAIFVIAAASILVAGAVGVGPAASFDTGSTDSGGDSGESVSGDDDSPPGKLPDASLVTREIGGQYYLTVSVRDLHDADHVTFGKWNESRGKWMVMEDIKRPNVVTINPVREYSVIKSLNSTNRVALFAKFSGDESLWYLDRGTAREMELNKD